MRRAALLVALSTAAMTGCAAWMARAPDPRLQLNEGALALDMQEYARARALLEPLAASEWDQPVGQRATLALIALDIDSRNPERNLESAADRAARLLNVPDLEPWIIPVAESWYLLAVELGAGSSANAAAAVAGADSAAAAPVEPTPRVPVQDVYMAVRQPAGLESGEAVRTSGRVLPAFQGVTVPTRIARVEAERDSLRRRVQQVETELAEKEEELKTTKQELERIKRTIKPEPTN